MSIIVHSDYQSQLAAARERNVPHVPFVRNRFRVRRDHILEDAFEQLNALSEEDLRGLVMFLFSCLVALNHIIFYFESLSKNQQLLPVKLIYLLSLFLSRFVLLLSMSLEQRKLELMVVAFLKILWKMLLGQPLMYSMDCLRSYFYALSLRCLFGHSLYTV